MESTTLLIFGIVLIIILALVMKLILDNAIIKIGKENDQKYMSINQNLQSTEEALNNNLNNSLYRNSQQQNQLFDNYQKQLSGLKESIEKEMSGLRIEITSRLEKNEDATDKQLDKMRHLVDEKLHKTLEERLGHSFQMVNKSLVEVQKGLGEMQTLASGVGDLKKVLSNVKTRGILGEMQLGNILEQVLTKEQYSINVATIPNSRNHIEFAIKFPGPNHEESIWLPIDSKFPLDMYERLVTAYEGGDSDDIDRCQKVLINTVKLMAKDIRDKYIGPPYTTDFGILFLPLEGLYAELVRESDLLAFLQREMKIMIAGPSNLAAFLNSLRMGFRTLAIEKRSSEVWKVLDDVKNEFWKFGKRRRVTTSDELREVLQSLVEGKKIIHKFTEAVGCFINQNDPLK